MPSWQFSESSQVLLKQCIGASSIDNNNKWIQKFGKKLLYFNENNEAVDANTVTLNNKTNENITIAADFIEIIDTDSDDNTIDYVLEGNKDSCREILELDPVIHFDYIVTKCLKNPKIFPYLAERLPIGVVEKLCEHIYNTENGNSVFIEHFYNSFLPTFVKREPTRLSLDLIVKARCYPEYFKQLIAILLQDIKLPNNIIHEYVSMLNSNEHVNFLNNLNQLDVTNDVFVYHLSAIHTAYKNSVTENDNKLQMYIFTKLIDISQYCKTSKQYGRFFLTFLQSLRSCPTNVTEIQHVIDNHGSAFKKPCQNILSAMKEDRTSNTRNF